MTIASNNHSDAELAKFDRMASRWWDPEGEFKPLHKMNPVRANYIDERARVAGKRVLDVGCGGGLLTEALAERGAEMTGIDLAEGPLEVARLHAKENKRDIQYLKSSAEDLAVKHPGEYDVVTCLEMLEHVPEPRQVIRACASLVTPGGDLFFSTLNRHPKSYLMAILGAEYVLNWLPKGTHDYKHFIRPAELSAELRGAGLVLHDASGIIYSPFSQSFSIHPNDLDVNYIVHASLPS